LDDQGADLAKPGQISPKRSENGHEHSSFSQNAARNYHDRDHIWPNQTQIKPNDPLNWLNQGPNYVSHAPNISFLRKQIFIFSQII
jgi:hypothetical protein